MAAVTWNSADKNANIALSGGNLIATSNAGSGSVNAGVRATQAISSTVKTYFEITVTGTVGQYFSLGVMNGSASLGSNIAQTNGIAFANKLSSGTQSGLYKNGGTYSTPSVVLTSGQVVRIAVDLANNKLWWAINNNTWSGSAVWMGDGTANNDPNTGTGGASLVGITAPIYPAISSAWTGDVATFNGGTAGFAYVIPSGFVPLDGAPFVELAGNLGGASPYGKLSYGLKQYSRVAAFVPILGADLTVSAGVVFSGDFAPAVSFAADLDVIGFVDLGGDFAPQVALGGSLSLDLPLTALEGGLTPIVVLGASSFVSGPLWVDAEPCPSPPWTQSEPCPPSLWTPVPPPQWQLQNFPGSYGLGPYGTGKYNLTSVTPWYETEPCDGG